MRIWSCAVCTLVALGLGPFSEARPKKAAPTTHTVKLGDTLGGIAKTYGCSVQALKEANRLADDRIVVGKDLRLPGPPEPPRLEPLPAEPGAPGLVVHVVMPGETVAQVAQRYATTPEAIAKANRLKKPFLRVGQRLKVPTSVPARARHRFVYVIRSGDTLGGIAERFGVDWKLLQVLNPKKKPESLKIGDRLLLYAEGPPERSHAVGRPQDGLLVHGEQMPPGPGYFRRRPDRAWGTNETVTGLLAAIADVRKKHARVHDLAIGDLSKKDGGFLPPHKSHQSGRDVDLGYFFLHQPSEGPKGFVKAAKGPLDFEANWTFVRSLVGAARGESKVEYIFMNYAVQKLFYTWAKAKGVPDRTLEYVFQYPHGKRAMRGIIRHEPGHDGHMHVRFKCPPQDDRCS